MPQPRKQIHIGILADYGSSLLPQTGIGVFVYNLIEGLLQLDVVPKLTLVIHDGDQAKLRDERARWEEQVRIEPPEPTRGEQFLRRLASMVLDASDWFDRAQDRTDSRRSRKSDGLEQRISGRVRRELDSWRHSHGFGSALRAVRIGLLTLFLTLLFPVIWGISGLLILLSRFLIPFLAFPFRITKRFFISEALWSPELRDSWMLRKASHLDKLQARVDRLVCDVWLVPYAGTPIHMKRPHVVSIPDLVYRHIPEIFSAEERRRLESFITNCAHRATLIHCMTRFAADHDVAPCFPDQASRIRVVRLAPPMNLPNSVASESSLNELCDKFRIGRRFIFYPAALRAHKNHVMLIRALRLLRDSLAESQLELICTGELLPASDLHLFIKEQRLTACVHFLGHVSRADIAAIYRHAQLTALPSFHEGWGIPLSEAMQYGCPVTCSDIPAFREQLEECPETVPLFNPWDPNSIAKAIKLTIIERSHYSKRQREAYERISSRNWRAVAGELMTVFNEAIELSGETSKSETVASAH